MQKDVFAKRHIGISSSDQTKMLKSIGVASMDELINKTIPGNILLKNELNLPKGMSEFDYLNEIMIASYLLLSKGIFWKTQGGTRLIHLINLRFRKVDLKHCLIFKQWFLILQG